MNEASIECLSIEAASMSDATLCQAVQFSAMQSSAKDRSVLHSGVCVLQNAQKSFTTKSEQNKEQLKKVMRMNDI